MRERASPIAVRAESGSCPNCPQPVAKAAMCRERQAVASLGFREQSDESKTLQGGPASDCVLRRNGTSEASYVGIVYLASTRTQVCAISP